MLVAARLRHYPVAEAVRAATVPTDRAAGAPPGDRLYYSKLQRLCYRYLATDDAATDETGSRKLQNFETALRGEQPVTSDETLLWHTLVTPLDLGDLPTHLPRGVVKTDTGYELTVPDGKIDLCWIDTVPHWLGGLNGEGPSRPVRTVTPAAFFISTAPLTAAPGQHGRRWASSFADALALLRRLADETSLPVREPTADEWEMAARGPDGRFYPWGVGLQPGWPSSVSPWGVGGWAEGMEWAIDDATGEPTLVGGERPLPAASRRRPGPDSSAGIRLMVPG
jgi:hypothetical protein